MNRRSFFAVLAAVPVLGKLVPTPKPSLWAGVPMDSMEVRAPAGFNGTIQMGLKGPKSYWVDGRMVREESPHA